MALGADANLSLAERLRPVHVGVRGDLEVSRHLFRGAPAYLVRDPLTCQSHRLSVSDYRIFTALDAGSTLSDVFDGLLARGELRPQDEERFYSFVFQLHRIGLLQLPLSDDKLLYRRSRARRAAAARRALLSPIFLRIPLWNPDRFLDRTLSWVSGLYSRGFFLAWVLLQLAALAIVVARRNDLYRPLSGLLAGDNLAALWVILVALKAIHEFGHAYACKRFGAEVREMGVYLIVGTPCAYVDATAAWTLPSRLQRLIIGLGGIYFELTVAAIATFVWAGTGPGALHALSHNVMFVASAATILFNINPLLRYDGYYLLSDLVGVPNLRGRAQAAVHNVCKRLVLGIQPAGTEQAGPRWLLMCFGTAAPVYRTVVLLGIATLLALKLQLVGLVIAALLLVATLWGALRRTLAYLWFSEETAPVRGRAVCASVVLLVALPVGLGFCPVGSTITASAVLRHESEIVVRAAVPGFVTRLPVQSGAPAQPGTLLAQLENDELTEALLECEADCTARRLRMAAYQATNPALAAQESFVLAARLAKRSTLQARADALSVVAPQQGSIAQCVPPTVTGCYVEAGTPIATLADGPWEARFVLSAAELAAAGPQLGGAIDFRARCGSNQSLRGVITRILPTGSPQVPYPQLTQLGGGAIIVTPQSGAAEEPFFELHVRLEESDLALRSGLTGLVRLRGESVWLAQLALRRAWTFVDSLLVR